MSTYRTLSFDIHEDAVAMSFFIRHGDMYVFSTEKGLYTVTNGQCRFHGHLAAVGGVSYRYRMEGVDDEWHITDNNRTIFYRNLPFGTHRLKIEVLGMPEISAHIEVDVPLTYTAINYTILFFLVLLLVGHVVYCKVRKKEYIWKRFLPKPVKYQTSRIDPKEGERLTKALVALMNEKKPYLDANIQMSDFARMLGCSTHTLSQVFTLFIKRNYYDFISEYRIEEFKRLSRDPKYAKYTITALSNQCGFRSRTPFLVAFKKFTGMTPKEWMKGEK